MKTLLNIASKLLLVLLFVSLSNCQKEEITNNLEEETVQKMPTIRTLSLDNVGEVFNRLKRNLKIDSYLQLEHQTNTLAKTSQDTLGITIYTDVIKEVTLGNYTSYTMRVASPNTDDSKFYNVTIEDKNGESDIFVTKYTPTQNWLNDTNAVFEGNISTIRTNDFTDVFDVNPNDESNDTLGDGFDSYLTPEASPYYPIDCIGDVYISYQTVTICTCAGHIPSECDGCSGWETVTIPYYTCVPYVDNDINDNSDPIDSNNPNSGNTNNPTGPINNTDDPSLSVLLGPDDDVCDELPPGDLNGDCQISFYEGCLLNGNSPEVCSCADQGEDLNVCIVTDCLDTSYLPGFLQLSIANQASVANYLRDNSCSDDAQEEIINFTEIAIDIQDAKLERYLELVQIIEDDPWALIQNCAEQNGLDTSNYLDLYNLPFPQECTDRLLQLGTGFGGNPSAYAHQPITDGNVPLANIDYYGVEIINYPDFNNDGTPDSESEMYQAFRDNFIDLASGEKEDFQFNCNVPGNSTNTGDVSWDFVPFLNGDEALFVSDNPITAILLIEAEAEGLIPSIANDEGAVIVSDFTDNDWTISTIITASNGTQPFSGNRQWGWIINQNGNLEFFTRAVDVAKIAKILNFLSFGSSTTECQQDTYYNIAEATWQNMQEEISQWVNDNGGQANIVPSTAVRVDKEKIEELLTSNETIEEINCD